MAAPPCVFPVVCHCLPQGASVPLLAARQAVPWRGEPNARLLRSRGTPTRPQCASVPLLAARQAVPCKGKPNARLLRSRGSRPCLSWAHRALTNPGAHGLASQAEQACSATAGVSRQGEPGNAGRQRCQAMSAPSVGLHTYTLGTLPIRRVYSAAVKRLKSSAASAWTKATAQPPKPAPVMRAP